jgi:hypothetical protein
MLFGYLLLALTGFYVLSFRFRLSSFSITIRFYKQMPNFILTRSSVIMCPHGAPVTHIPLTNQRATVNGELVLFPNDHYLVAGCPFSMSQGSSPCYGVVWTNASKNFMMQGKTVLTSGSIGLVQTAGGVPQGAAIITSYQTVMQD